MDRKIAIEPNLSPIRDYLTDRGFQVEDIRYGAESRRFNPDEYAAIIITGQDRNFMGMNDIKTKAPVIDASGLTPQDVFSKLENMVD